MTIPFMAFQNETDIFEIGNLIAANRLDRILLHGSLDITKDKQGLEYAFTLKRIIDAAIDEMKRDKNLPVSL